MENKDKPAYAIQTRSNHEAFDPAHMGLSKRELMAAMVLQGYISNSNPLMEDLREIISDSIIFADALLAELQK